jgi:Penicillin-Binding Protein C-terminus Family
MRNICLPTILTLWILTAAVTALAQHDHKGMAMPMKQTKPALQPAEGASVKIISPKNGQVITGDKVPLEFKLTKGKRGQHVHAYVDGEMMGMFASEKGTLNGVKSGRHTLELRVVTADHVTELNATDKVSFTTK